MHTQEGQTTQPAIQPDRRPSKILLVDDEPSNRFLMRDILSNRGYEIVEAENGRIAIEAAEAESPDTVLLDVMMPEMDGFEACRRLKQMESTRRIPVLMVSALSDRKRQIEGISAGAADFITKPIDIRDMLLRVSNAVSGKRLLDEVSENCRRLEALEANREALMLKIVHDLRSPLSGVSGNLQLLQMIAGAKLDEDEALYLQTSLESVDLLASRLDTLLGARPEVQSAN
jgi:two-component system sensor histidine kinase/response regulator